MVSAKVTAQHYYSQNLTAHYCPGDIWSGLPTHGLLNMQDTSGLIVTPACDLSQRKVDTLTYLPILSVRRWLVTTAFVPEVVGQLKNLLQTDRFRTHCPPIGRIPTTEELIHLSRALESLESTIKESDRSASLMLRRMQAAKRLLDNSFATAPQPAVIEDLKLLFTPKTWTSSMEKLVRNALRLDLHFLPPDEQDPIWSAVPEPSVVLYRYPLTAPLDIFEAAEDLHGNPNWTSAIGQLGRLHPISQAFTHERPMRRATLRDRFLADLMTRYLAVYLRLGSPDFSTDTVSIYAGLLGGQT